MRETWYRGKRKDNGEWVKGGSIIKAQDGIWIIPTGGIIQYVADSRELGYVEAIPVVPETVCEFTGLTDKNGKKIFEGDILTFAKGATRPFRVTWDGICWKMFFLDNGKRIKYAYEIDEIDYMRRSEIIGNIHDNPELLEENKCVL